VKTMYRRMQILSMIPRCGTITTQQIEERLAARGLEGVSRRMIQRDLDAILKSGYFPITYEQDGQAFFWSWAHGARIVEQPTIEPHTALTFCLVNDQMPPMLPSSSHRYLDPYFATAKAILNDQPELPVSRWRDKVRTVSRSLPMTPPPIADQVRETVYEAVLRENRLAIRYRQRGTEEAREYPWLNPLGLVLVESLIYLIATVKQHTNPLQFLLHRMESAVLQNEPAILPKGFSLQAYIESGEFGYPVGRNMLRLKAAFSKRAATYLYETPLPGTISLEDQDDDTVLLEAKVQDNRQLRWWLNGFGAEVEVLEPAELRKEFVESACCLWEMYE